MKKSLLVIALLTLLAERPQPLATVVAQSAAPVRRTPNVVVILADDLGYGDLSCYGATKVNTPNADRLAREGRRFTNAYTPSSICSPTRYALMTGRYCWRTALQREVLSYRSPLHIEPSRMTLASLFKKHGYATAAIGKWHLGYGPPPEVDWNKPLQPGPLELGFDYHFGLPSNHGDRTRAYVENYELVGRKAGARFIIEDPLPQGLDKPRVDDRVNITLTEKAVAFIERSAAANKDQPFFLYFTPVAVHNPVTPNKQFRGKSQAGLYGDFILELDWAVGQILATLDRLRVADDTLVIFSSDNGAVVMSVTGSQQTPEFPLTLEDDAGAAVSAHYRIAKWEAEAAGHKAVGELRGRKHSIYEGGFKVPFLVRWPRQIKAGTTSDEIISLADVLATCAAILGEKLPAKAGEDSYNVLPAWRGDKLKAPLREATVLHNAEGVFAIRQGPWKLIEARDLPAQRDNQWKAEGKQHQLYNLAADPRETTNVWDKHPALAARLQALLNKYRRAGRSR